MVAWLAERYALVPAKSRKRSAAGKGRAGD
jgi:hypothetical protein